MKNKWIEIERRNGFKYKYKEVEDGYFIGNFLGHSGAIAHGKTIEELEYRLIHAAHLMLSIEVDELTYNKKLSKKIKDFIYELAENDSVEYEVTSEDEMNEIEQLEYEDKLVSRVENASYYYTYKLTERGEFISKIINYG